MWGPRSAPRQAGGAGRAGVGADPGRRLSPWGSGLRGAGGADAIPERVRRRAVHLPVAGGHGVPSVVDEGPGIPRDARERVLEPFAQRIVERRGASRSPRSAALGQERVADARGVDPVPVGVVGGSADLS